MGDVGLQSIARQCHNGIVKLLDGIKDVKGVERRFLAPVFHEAVIKLPKPAAQVLLRMQDDGILGGYDLGEVHPSLADCMLTNVTETKTDADIASFLSSLQQAVVA